MGKVRSEVGFWAAVGRLKLSDLASVEVAASLVLGVGLTVALSVWSTLDVRQTLASTYVGVAAALVAIVFAGLALVVSLLSDTYLRLLRSGEGGLLAFFRPFTLAIGVQVGTIITAVLYEALASVVPKPWEAWSFGLVSVLFFSSCFEIVVLTRSVLMHALLRSKLGEVAELESQRDKRGRSAS